MKTERLKQLFTFLEENPNDAFVNYAIATEYVKKGDDDEALKYYLMLLEKHPNYVATYYHLGHLYERRESYPQALSIYESGMKKAEEANDQHSLNELKGAHQLLSLDMEDEW